MTKRERMLGGFILAILVGWLIIQFGILNVLETVKSRKKALKIVHETYDAYVKKLEMAPHIKKRYGDVVGDKGEELPGSSYDAEKEFSEFVADLCKQLGFRYPRIQPPEKEEIEGVEDYEFITLTVDAKGNLSNVSKLLKGFEQQAVLIRDLSLGSTLDRPDIDVSITVARLVKSEPEEEKNKGVINRGGEKKSSFKSKTQRKSL